MEIYEIKKYPFYQRFSGKPKCIGTHIFSFQITLRYPMFIVNLPCVTMLDQIKVKNTFVECV